MEEGIKEGLLHSERGNGSESNTRVWEEVKKLWRIAAPTIVTRVSGFGIIIVTQAYIGRIGPMELASFALVQSIIMRLVDGILIGAGSSLPTVCGQAFGAGKYHMMGIYLQQSWIILFTASLFMLPAFFFTTPILRSLGEPEELSIHAGKLSLWFIPLFLYQVIAISTQTFLQSQHKISIVGWASAISFVLNMILSWVMVDKLSWGISGAMGAMNLSFFVILSAQFIYIFGGWCKDCWKGFSKSAFNELWPFLKLSVSSGVMLCFEFWNGAVLVLLVGNMKNAEVAISAFSICLNINAWVYMISLGFLGAASVRVANELGKGDAKAAKFTIKLNLSVSLTIGAIFCIIALVYGKSISFLFTSSIEVAEEVSSLSILLASIILLNSVQAVLSGVAIGCGRQSLVAGVNLFCFYIVGFPLGIFLGYVMDLQVRGIWAGMICGTATQTIFLSYITWRTDWDAQVGKTMARFDRWIMPSSEEVSSDITSQA